MNLPTTTFSQLARDARLLILSTGLLAISFFGIQMLLAVLYVLRLGYSVEYVGLFNASGALTYILASLPAGAVGSRFGLRAAMVAGGVSRYWAWPCYLPWNLCRKRYTSFGRFLPKPL